MNDMVNEIVTDLTNSDTLWKQVSRTDPRFTKNFTRGGGFRGTAIDPLYNIHRMTKLFGPIGHNWGFREIEHRIEEGSPGDKIWFSKVELWYRMDGMVAKVEQWGATTFAGKTKSGVFTDEEAAKKSITDAVSKCLSLIGFSADVFLGAFDSDKYTKDKKAQLDAAASAMQGDHE